MKTERIIYIATIAVISFLFFKKCKSDKQKIGNLKYNQKVSEDSIKYFKNSLGQEVAEKRSYIGTNSELKELINSKEQKNSQLRDALKRSKRLLALAKIKTVTKIDTIEIPYKVPVEFEFERFFKKDTDFYCINGIASNLGVKIDEFEIYNEQIISFDRKRIGMFKTQYVSKVFNSNPYIKVTGLDSYQFIEKQKRFGVSLFGGYVLTSNLALTPAIGIGVTYDLIRF